MANEIASYEPDVLIIPEGETGRLEAGAVSVAVAVAASIVSLVPLVNCITVSNLL